MRFLVVSLFLIFTFSVSAQEALSFKNVREGKSIYEDKFKGRDVRKTLKKISKNEIIKQYLLALKKQKPTKACAFDLNKDILLSFKNQLAGQDLKGVIYILRQENIIDDVVAKILLSANKVLTTTVDNSEIDEDKINLLNDDKLLNDKINLITSFKKRFAVNSCLDEAYHNYHEELLKIDNELTTDELEVLNFKALTENRISEEQYLVLEQARLNELEKGSLSLTNYLQKIKTIRTQFPLRDVNEKNDFTGFKATGSKESIRQKLFENYSDIQIIIMGNVIKKLRARLEYDLVTIVGSRKGIVQEAIQLEPMERFLFAIKEYRKEMALLSLNSYFYGISPSDQDLMMASYELGIIPTSELATIISLEDIWNPKKTFWDKAGVWVKSFSTVLTVAIPAPFGFIPALAIVVIEQTVAKKKKTKDLDPSVLF